MNAEYYEYHKPMNIDSLSLVELYDLLQTFTNICSGEQKEQV